MHTFHSTEYEKKLQNKFGSEWGINRHTVAIILPIGTKDEYWMGLSYYWIVTYILIIMYIFLNCTSIDDDSSIFTYLRFDLDGFSFFDFEFFFDFESFLVLEPFFVGFALR